MRTSLSQAVFLLAAFLASLGRAWTEPARKGDTNFALGGWSRYAQCAVGKGTTFVRVFNTTSPLEGYEKVAPEALANTSCYNLASPREWLESLPPGAYTVIRCDYRHGAKRTKSHKWKVWGRDFHMRRLEESYLIFTRQTRNKSGPSVSTATKHTDDILHILLAHAEEELCDAEDYTENFAVTSFMVTILWHRCHEDTEIFVLAHIRGMGSILDARVLSGDPITAVLALAENGNHQAALPNRKPNPEAKLSSWCSRRRPLERAFKGPEVGEVLLVDHVRDTPSGSLSGYVLEGLTSNLFVLYKDGILRTAGKGVLLGYARQTILESASRLGVVVDTLSPIDIRDSEQWQEVFLSSATKILSSVNTVLLPAPHNTSNASLEEIWSFAVSESDSERVYQRIYRDIMQTHLMGDS